MTRLRNMSARDALKALNSFGFQILTIHGSHAKLRRVIASGERQTLTVPLNKSLTTGTLLATFRQASRYVPEADLKTWFFTEQES